ncbi:MAG: alanine--tRNA ligase-related protein [Patescibacteria group bacterium]
MMLSSQEIRKKFLNFFGEKGHIIVPSLSLVTSDPSVLLTTAGVQQFKPYYTGQLDPKKDFKSSRVISIQKCFRATDIDEVGDDTHLTFFEMLGNFCFDDYWKKEVIEWGYEFITKELGIEPERVSVTVFSGTQQVPRDDESYKIWHEQIGLPEEKIKFALWDNFWGPTGSNGPCGPTTEIYIDGIEVWNIVFNEYFCNDSRENLLAQSNVEGLAGNAMLEKLKKNGIDTGMGLERLSMAAQGVSTIFETDLFNPLMIADSRVLADHIRGIVFLIADGVRPSNKEAGYILRRLMRKVIVISNSTIIRELFKKTVDAYGIFYKELNLETILKVFEEENAKFGKTLNNGLRELKRLNIIDAMSAFKLFESFGLPYEVIKELGGEKTKNLKREDFDREFKKHQEVSRAGVEKKFGGHGLILDTGELKAGNEEELKKVTRLHTATHLLQQALRDVLGNEVQQRGSDITAERTRFDFSFDRKLTIEEIKNIEEIVNKKIQEDLPVNFQEMSKEEAVKTGALFFFKERYPEKIKVYYVGDSLESAYSAEFCGGPHVVRTGEIGKFKIIKEEAVGSGVRRIRGVVN